MNKKYKELEENFFLEFQGADATAFNAAALSMKLRQNLYLAEVSRLFTRFPTHRRRVAK